ncbi:hypothetical protein [Longitalea luteola]|uniref:hypothetical protein n=1 Tax=Longitalea luteola TaxID=2812563 RepID=UPI001A96585C|nr:hypothetical protein [Longitalea luteola]
MLNINNLCLKLLILLVTGCGLKAAAQPVSDAFQCSMELGKIKMALQDTTGLSFQAEYVVSYNDATSKTVSYQYRLSKHKMHYTASDSTEVIQNYAYNLALDHRQHRAVVSRPVDIFKYLTNINITDLSFYKLLVTGRSLSDTGNYRKLSYHFKPASPYRSYDIIYDPVSYRIQAIQYSFNMNGAQGAPAGSKMPFHVTVQFSNYNTGAFGDDVFATTGYFTRKQGNCKMVAPYSNYELINSLHQ